MPKTVFYSFHYDRDVHRVQLVRNIDALEGQPVLNSQEWESVRRRGPEAIETWIDDQMRYKRAVIVLVGQQTSTRPWVKYEIIKAWNDRRPMVGVRIHGLSSMGTSDSIGADPFVAAGIGAGRIPLFDPTRRDGAGRIDTQATYAQVRSNIGSWAERGVTRL
ncbi:TIR domain-containing protein [Rhodococcus sp. UNC23MFCrub1.1]|uniref:TIR domain-containing protein n=1 Tax=Rhodococcus sp. UNC23MFCrub1.1 TaxID=1449068 RepID=UPI0004847161|nr:TIR domain-containing protein [Rhodococcus sp. UNC23MFCrub1.1]